MWHLSPPKAVLVEVSTEQIATPVTCCIIWRRVNGRWDFFCPAPEYDTERIIGWDQRQTGLSNADYQARQG